MERKLNASQQPSEELGLAHIPEDDLPPASHYATPEEPEVPDEELIIPPPREGGENLDLEVQRAAAARAGALMLKAEAQREEERRKALTPPLQVSIGEILIGVTAAAVGLTLGRAFPSGLLTGIVGLFAFLGVLGVMLAQPNGRGWYVGAFSLLGAYLFAMLGTAMLEWLGR